MNITDVTAANIDYHLAFREAANKGNTAEMIQLKNRWGQLDINASGAKSLQTAAHRAASQGQVAALRLLYNLGANFGLTDKAGHKAKHYANTVETREFFTYIKIAKEALAERRDFFSHIIHSENCSRSESNALFSLRTSSRKQAPIEGLALDTALINIFKVETTGLEVDANVKKGILDNFNAAKSHLYALSGMRTFLEQANQSGSEIAACGEVAKACL